MYAIRSYYARVDLEFDPRQRGFDDLRDARQQGVGHRPDHPEPQRSLLSAREAADVLREPVDLREQVAALGHQLLADLGDRNRARGADP